ncbi:uncharacterized protein BYT42DRAFT_572375 [Radiomyces spectabilis]|uniref:uncharacterized protein n=1 Tax=Radiomyces spectabilis TaxID=64574 RepID=UPI00221FF273|nr:uncharacterized protein BYT42DRAFT_572375 [Radiomyces spectabilis]KAI8377980.1 hypothetical protein BYT42DRAFT_572375 [Radiomyces spectabilis]
MPRLFAFQTETPSLFPLHFTSHPHICVSCRKLPSTMFWKKKDKSPAASSTNVSASTNPFDTGNPSAQPTNSSDYASPGRYSSPAQDDSRYGSGDNSYGGRGNGGGRYGNSSNRYEDDRQDLFSGASSGRRYDQQGQEDAYGSSRFAENEEDEEVAGLKQQIRNVKQDTLQSTRNALAKINETEGTAANTMNMLGQQSSQIANVDRNLDLSKAYSDRAASQASELKQLNRSIFIPVVKNPFTKKSRNRKELEALKSDHAEHMAERDNIRQFEHESNARIDRAQRANQRTSANAGYRRGRSEADRQRYQFEGDSEDDQVEDEIDSNLDLLGDATSRLKNMALTMNDELDSQNKHLHKMDKKVDPINERLMTTTHTLNKTR